MVGYTHDMVTLPLMNKRRILMKTDARELGLVELAEKIELIKELSLTLRCDGIHTGRVMRKYGFSSEELEWLSKGNNIQNFLNTCEEEYKSRPEGSPDYCIYTRDEVYEVLYENRTLVIGLFRDGYSPKDIADDLNILINPKGWAKFLRYIKNEDIDFKRGSALLKEDELGE